MYIVRTYICKYIYMLAIAGQNGWTQFSEHFSGGPMGTLGGWG